MKKKLVSLFNVFFFIFCSILVSSAQKTADSRLSFFSEATQAFEKFVREQMKWDRIPGLSVGFLKDDFVWTKGFGYSDLENRVLAKPESSYRLASVTKTITAIAVLQLVEAGKINLDAEVQNYVPGFPRKNWPVTIQQLLGHLGGVSHYRNYKVEGHIKVHKNTEEAIAIFQDFNLVAEPGTKYYYSSYGYNLLGAAIEGASGKSYETFIKDNIFDPLGMKDSRMDDPSDLIPNRVKGYRFINGEIKNSEYVDISSRFAAGGTRSTVVDLLKYARGIIDGKLLKKETWQMMFASMANRAGYLTGYGMGWGVRPWRGHFHVNHGGSQPETRTRILIFPSEKFAIAMASNLENLNLVPYIRRLAELVLDEDLDSMAFLPDLARQAIYNACNQAFSYGISQFDWNPNAIPENEKDLIEAFAYFNHHTNEKALKRNFREFTRKLGGGIHPVSKRAFQRVGMFMASVLADEYGKKDLLNYQKKGPLAFFSDYIKISKKWSKNKNGYKLKKSFSRLISEWEKGWSTVYSNYVRKLHITVNTDFDDLSVLLKPSFSRSTIYPDLSREMERIAHYLMRKNDLGKAFKIFNLSCDFYPNTPAPLSGLASFHIWAGNFDKARNLYKQAFALAPKHPSVSLHAFQNFAGMLENAKKIKELFALVEIVVDLFPDDARVHHAVGSMYLEAGKKDMAIQYYKKALKLDPNLIEAREKLDKLEKEKRK